MEGNFICFYTHNFFTINQDVSIQDKREDSIRVHNNGIRIHTWERNERKINVTVVWKSCHNEVDGGGLLWFEKMVLRHDQYKQVLFEKIITINRRWT